MIDCSQCTHHDGLWGDPVCSHKKYCEKCIHSHNDLVDNFSPKLTSSNELDVYNYLHKKYGNSH